MSAQIRDPLFCIFQETQHFMAVCSSLGEEETRKRLDQERATKGGWKLANRCFCGGDPNPSACEKMAMTHKHYLFER